MANFLIRSKRTNESHVRISWFDSVRHRLCTKFAHDEFRVFMQICKWKVNNGFPGVQLSTLDGWRIRSEFVKFSFCILLLLLPPFSTVPIAMWLYFERFSFILKFKVERTHVECWLPHNRRRCEVWKTNAAHRKL